MKQLGDLAMVIIPILFSGILTYIWFDIRNAKEESNKKMAASEEKFLPRETHELICKAIVSDIKGEINVLKSEQRQGFSRLEELIKAMHNRDDN
jgi:hypothetical protein